MTEGGLADGLNHAIKQRDRDGWVSVSERIQL